MSAAESLLVAEQRTLQMIAGGASLAEVLDDLCGTIDAQAPRRNFRDPPDRSGREAIVAARWEPSSQRLNPSHCAFGKTKTDLQTFNLGSHPDQFERTREM